MKSNNNQVNTSNSRYNDGYSNSDSNKYIYKENKNNILINNDIIYMVNEQLQVTLNIKVNDE